LLREYPDVNDIQYGWLLYALGVFNFDIKDYENSEIRFREAIVHFTNCNFSYGITRSNTGLASVYLQHNDFKMAEELLQKSLHEYKKYESTSGESRVYNDLGTVYQKTGKPDEALNSFKKALEVRRIIPHQQGIATSLNEIASTLIDLNRHDEALPYLNEARDLSALINNKSKLYRTHFLLYKLYRAKENHKLALENFEIYDQVKSDVLGEASGNRIKALQTKMATEKSEKEAEIERLRNVELKSAYNLIEEKNKEILDSISYAKRIQQAILPSEKMVKKHLPESFVLYNPKDIVAGDFYWFHEITDSEFLIAACDCTGHGVPGALVSVVCHNALNRAVLEYKLRLPGEILDKTRQLVIEQFEKSDDGVKDGMDISLLYINTSARQCAWAGANNGLLVVCEGECTEYKPDKQPIGKFINAKNFITQKFSFEPGYMLYLFTDGYQDQFGGPKGKKFKASNLQKLLQSISNSPCDQQYNQLLTTFDQWRGPLEQVDDVCVLGLRL
jgi:serine phosphatase RsbU (regulator of sigma subunit)